MKVLLVDDYVDLAETVAELMRAIGHEAKTANSAAAALQKAVTWRPDLVLMDIRLGKENGCEVCRAIREDPRLVDCTVIATTGSYDPAITDGGLFDGVLLKPVSFSVFRHLLSGALPGNIAATGSTEDE